MSKSKVDSYLWEVVISRAKPATFLDYLKRIPKGNELIRKYGGKPLGSWWVEAGANWGPEVIYCTRYGTAVIRVHITSGDNYTPFKVS